MRVGVLTHSAGDDNYGQILQCYALQQYLRQNGHDPFLIQHKVNDTPRHENLRFLKEIVRYIRAIFSSKYRKAYNVLTAVRKQRKQNATRNILRGFHKFKSDNIELSRFYPTLDDLINDPPKADVYIVGSDQVWNPSLNSDSALAWYLRFGPKDVLRVSYAASFGRIIHETEYGNLCHYLRDFKAVSVRESTALENCKKAGVNDVTVVVDPTLLVHKDVYMPFVKKEFNAKPYLFLYYINVIDKADLEWKQIETFVQEKNLTILPVSSSGYYPAFDLVPGQDNMLLTIPEWINAIYHSEFVVTTSFHGVVFAIIMHRPFVAIPLKGEYSSGNIRITSLLHSVGLEDHLLTDGKNVKEILSADVNWENVDNLLAEQRKMSEEFLSEALKY